LLDIKFSSHSSKLKYFLTQAFGGDFAVLFLYLYAYGRDSEFLCSSQSRAASDKRVYQACSGEPFHQPLNMLDTPRAGGALGRLPAYCAGSSFEPK
jgi:hypothetical protein